MFPITLHIKLLYMRRQPQQCLGVRQSGAHLVLQEGSVPHSNQTHYHGDVTAEGGLEEVAVHVVGAVENFLEQVETVY